MGSRGLQEPHSQPLFVSRLKPQSPYHGWNCDTHLPLKKKERDAEFLTLVLGNVTIFENRVIADVIRGFPGSVAKNPPANAGDTEDGGSTPGWGRSPGVGNGNSLHYSYLENPTDRGAWTEVGYSPWGCRELDTPEHLSSTQALFHCTCIPDLLYAASCSCTFRLFPCLDYCE